jgi:hypothetical protein
LADVEPKPFELKSVQLVLRLHEAQGFAHHLAGGVVASGFDFLSNQPGAPLIRGFRMSGTARRNTLSSTAIPDNSRSPSPPRRKHASGSCSISTLRPENIGGRSFRSAMGGTKGCDSRDPLIRTPRMSGAPSGFGS